jgi:hypothetical protein
MRKSLGIVTLHVASPFGHVGSRTWSARSGLLYWVVARSTGQAKQELAALQVQGVMKLLRGSVKEKKCEKGMNE